jgi:hypothetical protein
MRFILAGRTFDTQTSTTVAIARGHLVPDAPDPSDIKSVRFEYALYRTGRGAFFVHEHSTTKFRRGKPVVSDHAQELTPEAAVKWITEHSAAIVDATGLPLPPEA